MQRRQFNKSALLSGTGLLGLPAAGQVTHTGARIIVVGGGFGGATAARTLKTLIPSAHITLLERNRIYTACPFSNLVIGTDRTLTRQQFSYTSLSNIGINVTITEVSDIDPVKKTVTLAEGDQLSYDRLVMSPGIELDYTALSGYDASAARVMPHAWQAGGQTALLARRLREVPQGGLIVIAPPQNPYRCPPGPYERASLMAHYLKKHNPSAKLLILDAKDQFSKQALFTQGWAAHYPGIVEWQGAGDGGRVRQVDPVRGVVETDFDTFRPDLANIIPPQRAASIARRAGLTDASGWCPINALTFASVLQNNIHVLGDASIANAMPKSAFSANAQAKLCAVQIARSLNDQPPVDAKLINTCYSLLTPEHGITVAGVYTAQGQRFAEVPGAGGTSPLDATPLIRNQEAEYAANWFQTLTTEVFG